VLDALTEFAFEACVAAKPATPNTDDPVEALRRGWDDYVEFGLSHPALFTLMYSRPQSDSGALRMAHGGVRNQMTRVAEAGRLRLDQERAALLLHAAASGLVLALLRQPEQERDMSVSDIARDAAVAAVTLEKSGMRIPTITATAVTLQAQLHSANALSEMERGLMSEWLDRIAHSHS
jgi:hypothetical protein